MLCSSPDLAKVHRTEAYVCAVYKTSVCAMNIERTSWQKCLHAAEMRPATMDSGRVCLATLSAFNFVFTMPNTRWELSGLNLHIFLHYETATTAKGHRICCATDIYGRWFVRASCTVTLVYRTARHRGGKGGRWKLLIFHIWIAHEKCAYVNNHAGCSTDSVCAHEIPLPADACHQFIAFITLAELNRKLHLSGSRWEMALEFGD